MQVEHLFSYPLYHELWNQNLIDNKGFIIADQNDLKRYKAYIEEQPVLKGAENYKDRKNVLDKAQKLLKFENLTPRQSEDLYALLQSLNLEFGEEGYVVVKSDIQTPKKYPGVREPSLSIWEQKLKEEEEGKRILKRDITVLDKWLSLICFSDAKVRKPVYSPAKDWKELERKCRMRTRSRLNEMEIKRRNKINSFNADNDHAWKLKCGMKVPPRKISGKKVIEETPLQKATPELVGPPQRRTAHVSVGFPKKEKISEDKRDQDKQFKMLGSSSPKLTEKREEKVFALGDHIGLSLSEREVLRRESLRKRLHLFQRMVARQIGGKESQIKLKKEMKATKQEETISAKSQKDVFQSKIPKKSSFDRSELCTCRSKKFTAMEVEKQEVRSKKRIGISEDKIKKSLHKRELDIKAAEEIVSYLGTIDKKKVDNDVDDKEIRDLLPGETTQEISFNIDTEERIISEDKRKKSLSREGLHVKPSEEVLPHTKSTDKKNGFGVTEGKTSKELLLRDASKEPVVISETLNDLLSLTVSNVDDGREVRDLLHRDSDTKTVVKPKIFYDLLSLITLKVEEQRKEKHLLPKDNSKDILVVSDMLNDLLGLAESSVDEEKKMADLLPEDARKENLSTTDVEGTVISGERIKGSPVKKDVKEILEIIETFDGLLNLIASKETQLEPLNYQSEEKSEKWHKGLKVSEVDISKHKDYEDHISDESPAIKDLIEEMTHKILKSGSYLNHLKCEEKITHAKQKHAICKIKDSSIQSGGKLCTESSEKLKEKVTDTVTTKKISDIEFIKACEISALSENFENKFPTQESNIKICTIDEIAAKFGSQVKHTNVCEASLKDVDNFTGQKFYRSEASLEMSVKKEEGYSCEVLVDDISEPTSKEQSMQGRIKYSLNESRGKKYEECVSGGNFVIKNLVEEIANIILTNDSCLTQLKRERKPVQEEQDLTTMLIMDTTIKDKVGIQIEKLKELNGKIIPSDAMTRKLADTEFIKACEIAAPFESFESKLRVQESKPTIYNTDEIAKKCTPQSKQLHISEETLRGVDDLTQQKFQRAKSCLELSVRCAERHAVEVPVESMLEATAEEPSTKDRIEYMEEKLTKDSMKNFSSLLDAQLRGIEEESERIQLTHINEESLRDVDDLTQQKLERAKSCLELLVRGAERHAVEVPVEVMLEATAEEPPMKDTIEYVEENLTKDSIRKVSSLLDVELRRLEEESEGIQLTHINAELLRDADDLKQRKFERAEDSLQLLVRGGERYAVEVPVEDILEATAEEPWMKDKIEYVEEKLTKNSMKRVSSLLDVELSGIEEESEGIQLTHINEESLRDVDDLTQQKFERAKACLELLVRSAERHAVEVPVENMLEATAEGPSLKDRIEYVKEKLTKDSVKKILSLLDVELSKVGEESDGIQLTRINEESLRDVDDLTKQKFERAKSCLELLVRGMERHTVEVPVENMLEATAEEASMKDRIEYVEEKLTKDSIKEVSSLLDVDLRGIEEESEGIQLTRLNEASLRDVDNFTEQKFERAKSCLELLVRGAERHTVEVPVEDVLEATAEKASMKDRIEYVEEKLTKDSIKKVSSLLDVDLRGIEEESEGIQLTHINAELLRDVDDLTQQKFEREEDSLELLVRGGEKYAVEVPLEDMLEATAQEPSIKDKIEYVEEKLTEDTIKKILSLLDVELSGIEEESKGIQFTHINEESLRDVDDLTQQKLKRAKACLELLVRSVERHAVEVPVENMLEATAEGPSLNDRIEYVEEKLTKVSMKKVSSWLDVELREIEEESEGIQITHINEEFLSDVDDLTQGKFERAEASSELLVRSAERHAVEVPVEDMLEASAEEPSMKDKIEYVEEKLTKNSMKKMLSLLDVELSGIEEESGGIQLTHINEESLKDVDDLTQQKFERAKACLELLVRSAERHAVEVPVEDVLEATAEGPSLKDRIEYVEEKLTKDSMKKNLSLLDVELSGIEEGSEGIQLNAETFGYPSRDVDDKTIFVEQTLSILDSRQCALPILLVDKTKELDEVKTEDRKLVTEKVRDDIRKYSIDSRSGAKVKMSDAQDSDLFEKGVKVGSSRLPLYDDFKDSVEEFSEIISQSSSQGNLKKRRFTYSYKQEDSEKMTSDETESSETKLLTENGQYFQTIEEKLQNAGRRLSILASKGTSQERTMKSREQKSKRSSILPSRSKAKLNDLKIRSEKDTLIDDQVLETKFKQSTTKDKSSRMFTPLSKVKLNEQERKSKRDSLKHDYDLKTEPKPSTSKQKRSSLFSLKPKVKEQSEKDQLKEDHDPRSEPKPSTSKTDSVKKLLRDETLPRPQWPTFFNKKQQNLADISGAILERTRQMKANKGLILNKSLYCNLDDVKVDEEKVFRLCKGKRVKKRK